MALIAFGSASPLPPEEQRSSTSGNAMKVAAASAPVVRPDGFYVGLALLLIVAGVVIGTWVQVAVRIPTPVELAAEISAFAVFYILAQALERISQFIDFALPQLGATGGKTKEAVLTKRDDAMATYLRSMAGQDAASAENAIDPATATADAQHDVDKVRTNRSLIFWAINSFLAAIGCGYLGLNILHAIGVANAPIWFDLSITALAIGGGTKPLNDLIGNLQKAKEEKQDPKQVITRV